MELNINSQDLAKNAKWWKDNLKSHFKLNFKNLTWKSKQTFVS
jgi:hypothetical protein